MRKSLSGAIVLTRELSPALIVFAGAILFFFFTGKPTLPHFEEVFFRSLLRLLRFALFLCAPVFFALPVCFYLIGKTKKFLIRIDRGRNVSFRPFTHWLARPFQGIGIILLISTKLLISLKIIVSVPESSLFLPKQHFDAGHFLTVSAVTVLISFLLSVLWLFDDSGIRYINRRDKEIKMIGKYVGTLMPIIFGFYGIFTLRANFPAVEVLVLLFKITIVLYPPFVIFAVAHRRILEKKAGAPASVLALEERTLD